MVRGLASGRLVAGSVGFPSPIRGRWLEKGTQHVCQGRAVTYFLSSVLPHPPSKAHLSIANLVAPISTRLGRLNQILADILFDS